MIPKKIYLNYVDENDADKTWSEEPISVSGCEMKNREYTDLSQIWHDTSEEPQDKDAEMLWYSDKYNDYYITSARYLMGNYCIDHWEYLTKECCLTKWAYISDFLHKD